MEVAELLHGLSAIGLAQAIYQVCLEAYNIRMYAIEEYGRVIHEFDPYFNYRATEYLYAHGWTKFSEWFDYMSWYPLGRPVGTTIYPGMQVISVWIKNWILPDYSINDICVFVPTWFGVLATVCVAFLTLSCTIDSTTFRPIYSDLPLARSIHQHLLAPLHQFLCEILHSTMGTAWGLDRKSQNPMAPYVCAVAAAAIMSIVPAHIMRSVGGGYDNESIAVTAMVLTFTCWTTSLRGTDDATYTTIVLGVCTGVAYFGMVAAWGGYVFVLNLIALHAGVLALVLGRFTPKLHRAYSTFYLVGTALATQVPVVGWTPLKSLEQLGALAGFAGLQLLEIVRVLKLRKNGGRDWSHRDTMKLYVAVFGGAATVALIIVGALAPTGYFGPISSRVRGLFVQHTKTGNPLVDSVAEHQAASPGAYFQYLSDACYLAPVGLAFTMLAFWNDSSSFLAVYAAAAYYFSHRMVRLILLTAPIASVLGGICIGRFVVWGYDALCELLGDELATTSSSSASPTTNGRMEEDNSERSNSSTGKKKGKNGKAKKHTKATNGHNGTTDHKKKSNNSKNSGKNTRASKLLVQLVRIGIVCHFCYKAMPKVRQFHSMSHHLAKSMSHPTIITKGRGQDGKTVVVDDYRQAYIWLREHTPEDARIMAWWDYGYQIAGIANRTTLADGNTWNHEHIALLGRTLTASEKEAHRISRHLADYVLVWSGGGGDDVAKSPHLRRIANSVYRGLCKEPTCRDFGFYSDRSPTPNLGASLLYKLVNNGIVEGVAPDRNRFREVFASKYRKVRIYKIQSVSQESKDWVLNNRVCDAPGSWFCPGQYPPELQKYLKDKKDFRQLEDFNTAGSDEDYQKEYFENLNKKSSPGSSPPPAKKPKMKKLAATEIDMLNEDWTNTGVTTLMYELIAKDKYKELTESLSAQPEIAHVRSEDGRGPMFWAHEYGRTKMIKLFKSLGVSEERSDANGKKPAEK